MFKAFKSLFIIYLQLEKGVVAAGDGDKGDLVLPKHNDQTARHGIVEKVLSHRYIPMFSEIHTPIVALKLIRCCECLGGSWRCRLVGRHLLDQILCEGRALFWWIKQLAAWACIICSWSGSFSWLIPIPLNRFRLRCLCLQFGDFLRLRVLLFLAYHYLFNQEN